MYQSVHDGVLFVEGKLANCRLIRHVKVEIGGMFIVQSQLKTLKDVKDELARQAKAAGGNAVVEFKYGQKSVGFFRSLFQIDDINWYGSGQICLVEN